MYSVLLATRVYVNCHLIVVSMSDITDYRCSTASLWVSRWRCRRASDFWSNGHGFYLWFPVRALSGT